LKKLIIIIKLRGAYNINSIPNNKWAELYIAQRVKKRTVDVNSTLNANILWVAPIPGYDR